MTAQSFVDFLDRYGDANPPALRWQDGEDFHGWRTNFYEALENLRGPLPERVAPDVRVIEASEQDGYTRYRLEIPVSELTTLPALLLVPGGIAEGETRPGLIASHGHITYGMESVCGVRGMDESDNARRAYGLEAVRAGYVVLAPAWWGWAGRDGHVEKTGSRDKCNVIQMAAAMYGMNVIDLHIQDGQAAIDALSARPEVDASRIGCYGNSYGGRTTMWLTIFDERIAAAAPAGCMNVFRERSLKLSSCGIQYLPGLLKIGDVPELFSLIAPRPLQLQAGEEDGLITDSDRDHILDTVRRAYAALGAENNLDYYQHPEGHLLIWDATERFFRKHLG